MKLHDDDDIAGAGGAAACGGAAAAFGGSRAPAELGNDLDWVLVGLKSTALEQKDVLRELLEPCVAPTTRVQLLMNGLGAEEQCAEVIDAKRVHGGLVGGLLVTLADHLGAGQRGEFGDTHGLEGQVAIHAVSDHRSRLVAVQRRSETHGGK